MFFLCGEIPLMKRVCYIILFALSIEITVNGQQYLPLAEQAYGDSLAGALRSAASDSLKSLAAYLLADLWRGKDTAKAKNYLLQGRRLAGASAYLKALYPFYEGQLYFNTDRVRAARAFDEAKMALQPFPTQAGWGYSAAAWFNYGVMMRNEKGDSFLIAILIDKAIPFSEKSGDTEKMGHYYVQLATLLMNNAQFAKAELYNQKAIDLLQTHGPASTSLLFAYLSAASTFVYEDKYPPAKAALDKARQLLVPYPGSTNYPLYYSNEGLYYEGSGQYGKALASLDSGIALAGQYHQTILLQNMVFRKYLVYFDKKDYRKARDFLMGVVKEGSLMAEANNRRTLYFQLTEVYRRLGDMAEAYKWSAAYAGLSDSLSKVQLKEKIAGLEARYQNAEDQKKISLLDAEKTRAVLAVRNSRLFNWLLGTGCVLLAVIAGFSVLFVRGQRKVQQLKLARAMLEGEERERRRIAQDLHDGLGGMLAGVKINLSGWAAGNRSLPQESELQRIIGQLDQSVGELRQIARNMMPETLLKFGLETALKDLCEFYMRDDVHIEFQAFDIGQSLPLSWQMNIYRIAQELLNNAVRHARATNIILQCSRNAPVFLITVEDNGRGFDPGEGRKGMGLTTVASRVGYMNGKMEILSTPGEGTTINIELNTYADQ
jgi:signal transduction histidine kinase